MKIESLRELLVEQLHDLYDAEQRLTKALPNMAKAASSTQLKAAFKKHLTETEGHVTAPGTGIQVPGREGFQEDVQGDARPDR